MMTTSGCDDAAGADQARAVVRSGELDDLDVPTGLGCVHHPAASEVEADVAEALEEEDVAGRPSPYSAYELCGSSTPTRRYAQRTRPEQSNPPSGDSPPHLYGTPTSPSANLAARSALVGGGSTIESGPGLISLDDAVAGSPPAATRTARRQSRGTRLRRVVDIV